eukprot:m.119905 g.119905  ORF g.119905 m.119905 type:complete len:211 (+) comp16164_c0_seq1:86-718(+)
MDQLSDAAFQLSAVVANILCEFLEVAINSILYVRNVYPPEVFERQKKYNIPVQMARHPDLKKYIADIVIAMKPWISQNMVDYVLVIISQPSGEVVERFMFEMDTAPALLLRAEENAEQLDLESYFRAFLLKISICDAHLRPNPPDCTFSVFAHTKSSAALSQTALKESFPWLAAEKQDVQLRDALVVPIKSMDVGYIKMQLVAQESKQKQ